MAAELTTRVAQQLIDTRPSPGLEISKQLFQSPTSSILSQDITPTATRDIPSTKQQQQQSPPIAPLPSRAKVTLNKSQPSSNSPSKSPKGETDIFSLATDKQLADRYKFVEEIGYGNWVGFSTS